MKSKLTLLVFLFISVVAFSQYRYKTFKAHTSIAKAIQMYNEVIEGRTLHFEKKADEKPLMFQKTRIRVAELNRLAKNLSVYINKLQAEANKDQILYDLREREFYKNILFKSKGKLTYKGQKLKVKIDSLYDCVTKINVHKLSQLENFYVDNFKTDAVFYQEENEINYFEHLFYDTSNYGIMMAMNYLLLDVKTFQLLYYGTIMNY